MSGQLHTPATLPGTHWLGVWVDLRVDLDDMEKKKFLPLPGLELQPLGYTACSRLLYRLHYPIIFNVDYIFKLLIGVFTTFLFLLNITLYIETEVTDIKCDSYNITQ
jgi:hypothetical protein